MLSYPAMTDFETTRRPWIVAGAAVLAALLYALLWPKFSVGFANDDALYILGAQSLRHGQYVSLQYPRHPALTDPLPGYSLFLTPFVHWVAPHWSLLKATTILLTLVTGVLLWWFFAPWFGERERTLLAAMFWFNPYTAQFSVTLFSEPFFLFMISLFLLRMRVALVANSSRKNDLILGFLLMWIVLTRPQGVLLWASLMLGAALFKTVRRLTLTLLLPALASAAFMGRNVLRIGHPSLYFSTWFQSASRGAAGSHSVAQHWRSVLSVLFLQNGLGLSDAEWMPAWFAAALILLLIAVLLRGFSRWSKKSSGDEPVLFIVGTFLLLYFLVQTLWVTADVRYGLALVPFGLALMIRGLDFSASGKKIFSLIPILLFGGLLSLFAVQDVNLAAATVLHPEWNRPFQLPQNTYQWIRDHLPGDAMIVTSKPSTLFLYCHRSATFVRPATNRDDFRYQLSEARIDYVLTQPSQLSSPYYHLLWSQTQAWIEAWPEAFRLIYENRDEGTRLYQRVNNPAFEKKFEQTAGG